MRECAFVKKEGLRYCDATSYELVVCITLYSMHSM